MALEKGRESEKGKRSVRESNREKRVTLTEVVVRGLLLWRHQFISSGQYSLKRKLPSDLRTEIRKCYRVNPMTPLSD